MNGTPLCHRLEGDRAEPGDQQAGLGDLVPEWFGRQQEDRRPTAFGRVRRHEPSGAARRRASTIAAEPAITLLGEDAIGEVEVHERVPTRVARAAGSRSSPGASCRRRCCASRGARRRCSDPGPGCKTPFGTGLRCQCGDSMSSKSWTPSTLAKVGTPAALATSIELASGPQSLSVTTRGRPMDVLGSERQERAGVSADLHHRRPHGLRRQHERGCDVPRAQRVGERPELVDVVARLGDEDDGAVHRVERHPRSPRAVGGGPIGRRSVPPARSMSPSSGSCPLRGEGRDELGKDVSHVTTHRSTAAALRRWPSG